MGCHHPRSCPNRLCHVSVALHISLPRIVILGNQSSGKSSVIEAITGISLPRAKGTCTRCPTEVRLVQANKAWSCAVTLRIEQLPNGEPLQPPRTVTFGQPLSSPDLVEERLKRAQIALLSFETEKALDGIDSLIHAIELPKPQREFTENTVCLTIEDHNAVNLSFVDLPGLISNVSDGQDEGSIKLIENLARKSIQPDNCLVLLTVNASDDIQNQSGVKLAREVDPDGKRTIGVLTKADTIQKGDHDE